MTRAPRRAINQGDASRRLLDEMDFAVAALGALVTAARCSGVSLVDEGVRMEDLANRLLDLAEETMVSSEADVILDRSAHLDLQ